MFLLDLFILVSGVAAGLIILMYNDFTTKREYSKSNMKKVEFINNEFVLIDEATIEQVQSNFRDKVQYYDDEIQLLDSETIEQEVENFRERITHDYSSIELIDDYTVQKLIENFKSQIQYKEFKSLSNLGDELNKTVQKMLDTYIQEFNKEQKQANYSLKLSSKTIYGVVEDKYIDLIEKEIYDCRFTDNIVKYVGSIVIHVNIQNSSDFWYMNIKKNNTNIKYGFTLNQKKRIQNIVSYIKFSNGFELTKDEQKSFNYIKEKVNNEN